MSKNEFHKNRLYFILNISNKQELKKISNRIDIKASELQYYNDKMIFPAGEALDKILQFTGYTELELKLRMGVIDNSIIKWISDNPECILKNFIEEKSATKTVLPVFSTQYGQLYQEDCIDVMKNIPDATIDLIFADPPFNLNKDYKSGINDFISEQEYIEWTEKWILECVRILAPGGAIFIYNLPYWNTYSGQILNKYLNFRHWIAISMKGLTPVKDKLHPEHYSLLYYIKGERPKTFNQQRVPMATCRHCGGELRDYGGKKKDLDSKGLSIPDVFVDINPVRHEKYKNREANELPLKLLYRIISLASNEGDVVFDPFGGSGTTYIVSEYLKRNWIGSELGSVEDIVNRFSGSKDIEFLLEIEKQSNVLFTEGQVKLRKKNGFWCYDILQN